MKPEIMYKIYSAAMHIVKALIMWYISGARVASNHTRWMVGHQLHVSVQAKYQS